MMIGRAFDQRNSRTLLITGILLLSIFLFLLSFSTGFLILLLIIFLIKFASGFFHPAGIGQISRVFKKEGIDHAMGIQSASGNFGSFIAILTTLSIAVTFTWTIPLYLWSVIGIICFFTGYYLTRNTPLHYLYRKKTPQTKQTIKEAITEWKQIITRLKLLIPLFAVSITSYGITLSYLPLYLDEKTMLSLSTIGLITALWIGVGVITSFFYGNIQTHLTRKTLLTLAYSSIGVIGFILSLTTIIPLILILVILLGISTFLSFPALFSFISESTHETNEGKTFGYIFTLQLAVSTIFLFLSGALADLFGIWIPFTLLGLMGITATLILLIEQKKRINITQQTE